MAKSFGSEGDVDAFELDVVFEDFALSSGGRPSFNGTFNSIFFGVCGPWELAKKNVEYDPRYDPSQNHRSR